jgi:RNA polymerase sigma-70 factor (ECF subfamily)
LISDSSSVLEAAFREHRRMLWNFCYRLTGVAADADDIVQETFARAAREQLDTERPLAPWLIQVAANLGRDLLRARKRRGYAGPWLPSPIVTECEEEWGTAVPAAAREGPATEGVETHYDLLESASFAFLLALEVLTPSQRAVLLLREVLDYSVRETATVLGLSEGAIKVSHHRARAALEGYDRRRTSFSGETRERHIVALGQLLLAIQTGDLPKLRDALSPEVVLRTDGGGEYVAALNPIYGADNASAFFLGLRKKLPRDWQTTFVTLNGRPAVFAELVGPNRRLPRFAPRFALLSDPSPDGTIVALHLVLAPRKLAPLIATLTARP